MRWRCRKCERDSVAIVQSETSIRIRTERVGEAVIVQQDWLWGFATYVHSVTFNEEVGDRRAPREIGRTRLARSLTESQSRRFRRSFVRAAMYDGRRMLLALCGVCSIIGVATWTLSGRATDGLMWWVLATLAVPSALWAARFCAALLSYNHAASGPYVRFAWLLEQHSSVYALLNRLDGTLHIVTMRSRGPRRSVIEHEFVEDLCRYADRTRDVLTLNAYDPTPFVKHLGFRVDESSTGQPFSGATALIRHPTLK